MMMLSETLCLKLWSDTSCEVYSRMEDKIWDEMVNSVRNNVAEATFGAIIAGPVLHNDFHGLDTWVEPDRNTPIPINERAHRNVTAGLPARSFD